MNKIDFTRLLYSELNNKRGYEFAVKSQRVGRGNVSDNGAEPDKRGFQTRV